MTAQTMVKDVTGEMVALQTDFGAQAQRAAENHLANVWAWFHHDENGEDKPEGIDADPAIGAFCGCPTCEVRETLFAAIPFIEAGLAREDGAEARPLTINLISCPNEETADV